MAKFREHLKSFLNTVPGGILEAAAFAVMLMLICMFFTGNGEFIYEAF